MIGWSDNRIAFGLLAVDVLHVMGVIVARGDWICCTQRPGRLSLILVSAPHFRPAGALRSLLAIGIISPSLAFSRFLSVVLACSDAAGVGLRGVTPSRPSATERARPLRSLICARACSLEGVNGKVCFQSGAVSGYGRVVEM